MARISLKDTVIARLGKLLDDFPDCDLNDAIHSALTERETLKRQLQSCSAYAHLITSGALPLSKDTAQAPQSPEESHIVGTPNLDDLTALLD